VEDNTILVVGDFGPAIASDEVELKTPKKYLTASDYARQRLEALGRISLTPEESDRHQLSIQSWGSDSPEPILLYGESFQRV